MTGLRVLLVEDEAPIALLMEDMLIELGHDVVEIAAHLEPALEAAQSDEIDFALLDINLNGLNSFPVADALDARHIPYAFATGFGLQGIAEAYRDRPLVKKPFLMQDLAKLIDKAVPHH